MIGSELPEEDHVSRWCRKTHVEDGFPSASAFELREMEETLSVNWLEYFGLDRDVSIQRIREVIQVSLDARDRFAVLRVSEIKEAILRQGTSVSVTYDPQGSDPSHSLISWDNVDRTVVAARLAVLVKKKDVYPGLVS